MKCTRVLSNVVSVKENSDSLLKYELPLIIGNLLKNLPKQNDRILIYVRFISLNNYDKVLMIKLFASVFAY